MSKLQQFMDKKVEVEISDCPTCTGKLIDLGFDLILVFDEQQLNYFYIPLKHVQNVKSLSQIDMGTVVIHQQPLIEHEADNFSLRKILTNAKGRFVKIYVTGDKTIHGYITSVMSDYFVFYSPVYKAMFVSMSHLKWLVPYQSDHTPFTMSNQSFPVNPISNTLSRTFEDQCKKFEGKLVIFDLGDTSNKIGLLHKVENQMVELVNADGMKICWNLNHLKSVYVP